MKKLIGLLFSLTAMAQTDSVSFEKYVEGRNPEAVNYIKNSSCFKGITNITATNTTASKNTTTPLTSISDCQATLDSSSDTLEWSANTLDRSLKGGNCEVGIRYKLTLGSGNTIQLQARINSATVASANLVTSDNGTAVVNFPCGDLSNAPSLRIAQTAGSSSQAINVANVYLGAARNIGTVAQANLYGTATVAGTTNCAWSRTSNKSFASFSADADCPTATVTGNASAPATKIPAITFNNMPAGEYLFVAQGTFYSDTGGFNCSFRFSDGTLSSSPSTLGMGTALGQTAGGSLSGRITYTTAGSRTIEIQGTGQNGNNGCSIYATQATVDDLQISAYRFPSSSEIAVRANADGTTWTAFTPTGSWSSNSTYTGFYKCSNSTLEVQAKIATSGAPTSANLTINLPSGFTIDTAKITDSTAGNRAYLGIASAFDGGTEGYSGFVAYSSTTAVAVFAIGSSGTYSDSDQFRQDIPITFGSGDGLNIRYSVPVTSSSPCSAMQAPILVGSVTSNSTGAERIERVEFRCFSTSAINSQSGSWVTSVGNISSGACQVNIASGIFSAAPTCQVSLKVSTGTSFMYNAIINSISTSAIVVQGIYISSGSATINNISDNVFELTCQGAR